MTTESIMSSACIRAQAPVVHPTRLAPTLYLVHATPNTGDSVRADVTDAVLDAFMLQRLRNEYGASNRDIANAFGGHKFGKSAPCVVLTTSASWSAL